MTGFLRAALLVFLLSSTCRAARSDLDDLLDRLEQTSRNQSALAHIDTLLAAAELLPIKTYGNRRRQFLDSALSLLPSVNEIEPRYLYFAADAHLLAPQDRQEAGEICLRIPPRQSRTWRADYRGRCWQYLVDADRGNRSTVLDGLRRGAFHIPSALDRIADNPFESTDILEAMMTAFPGRNASDEDAAMLDKAARLIAPYNLALAAEAARRLRDVPRPQQPEPKREKDSDHLPTADDRAEEAFRWADDLALPPGERSIRFTRVLDLTGRMDNLTRRLQIQAYLAAWFNAQGTTGLAAKAADMLNHTLDTRCTGVPCLEAIDPFVEYIVVQRIDPEMLHVRHPSLGARLLLYELRIQLER